jgi:uncharacterized protein (TIGR00255 family)
MTGFGASEFEAGGARYACSVRSVNRRGFDLSLKVPPELAAAEIPIRAAVQEACSRGEATVTIDRLRTASGLRAEVDEDAARALWEGYRRVAAAVGSKAAVPLDVLLSSPDVVRLVRGPASATPEVVAAVLAGVSSALADLDTMRRTEGAALERDVRGRFDAIRAGLGRIREEEPAARKALAERAVARARAVAEAASMDADPGSLAMAVASLAEKADFSEEAARLDAHLAQVDAVLASEPPHGRRLDFLCQEVMREIGTLSAKASSPVVSHIAVDVKAELERVREQLANVL